MSECVCSKRVCVTAVSTELPVWRLRCARGCAWRVWQADARQRADRLDESLRESRGEADRELQRMQQKLERVNTDYFESKAECTTLEKNAKEATKSLLRAQEEVGAVKTELQKSQFALEKAQADLDASKARVRKLGGEVKAAQENKRQLDNAYRWGSCHDRTVRLSAFITRCLDAKGLSCDIERSKLKKLPTRAGALQAWHTLTVCEVLVKKYTCGLCFSLCDVYVLRMTHSRWTWTYNSTARVCGSEAHAQMTEQAQNMHHAMQQKQEQYAGVCQQLQEMEATCQSYAAKVEDLTGENAKVLDDLTAAREELGRKTTDFQTTVQRMSTDAAADNEKSTKSHKELVDMLEMLKKELKNLSVKKSALR